MGKMRREGVGWRREGGGEEERRGGVRRITGIGREGEEEEEKGKGSCKSQQGGKCMEEEVDSRLQGKS